MSVSPVASRLAPGVAAPDNGNLLEVRDLAKLFPITQGLFKKVVGHVRAVDGVSFTIPKGKTLGLVGESGCGKTTTSRMILRAFDPTSGQVLFQDRRLGWVDITKLDDATLRQIRPNMQMIFQDPYASLNPRMTLLEVIGEPLFVNGIAKGSELQDRVASLLKRVGLRPEYVRRYPHGFSGGQRQRIGIARALAPHPQLVVCDEPVSALDVSIQAQILNLLQDLQQELGLTYLFVAHDLSVVEHISDRVAVMYVGKLVKRRTPRSSTSARSTRTRRHCSRPSRSRTPDSGAARSRSMAPAGRPTRTAQPARLGSGSCCAARLRTPRIRPRAATSTRAAHMPSTSARRTRRP